MTIRKALTALGAMAFALATMVVPVSAAPKAGKDTVAKEANAQPAAQTPKTALVKKAKPEQAARVKARCKAGEKWDATASLNAGACVHAAKLKVKAAKTAGQAASKVG